MKASTIWHQHEQALLARLLHYKKADKGIGTLERKIILCRVAMHNCLNYEMGK